MQLSSLSFPKIQVIDLAQFQGLLARINNSPHRLLANPHEHDSQWLPFIYTQQDSKVSYEQHFSPQLKWKETVCQGISLVVSRMTFVAVSAGYVAKSRSLLGLDVEVFSEKTVTLNEVKKNNLYFDMENKLELRLGDTLIFYLSKN